MDILQLVRLKTLTVHLSRPLRLDILDLDGALLACCCKRTA
jgi:hypothetical protein